MDDVICITIKGQVDILFNHINNMDDHIKFTMNCPEMKEVFLSWTQSALQTLTTQYTPLCIENPHIQTDILTEIPTIQYLQKGQSFKHSPTRWYAPPCSC